jgi:cytochrome c-type biogenesis protein CcmH
MGQFLFFAALLVLLAIAFAVFALWRSARGLALALALGIPLAAAGLYWLKGTPDALDPAKVTTLNPQAAAEPATMEEAIAKLQARVAAEPDNFDDLVLLARSYMAVEKFGPAPALYARAMKLRPDDSDVSVEYAEALLRASSDHRFPPSVDGLLENAVAKNPTNQRALFFLGLKQMQDKHPADAAATWGTLMPMLEPDTARQLRPQLDAARAAAGLPPLPETVASTAMPPDDASAPPSTGLSIDVQIDPSLAKLAQPGEALYVFARAPGGGGPPLAVKRLVLGKFPLHLQLTDADSPMPAAKLSSQTMVILMARLSRTGDVQASSGDLEANPLQVRTDSKEPITLTLNRAVP